MNDSLRKRYGRAARVKFHAVRYEARDVLAGAYRGKDLSERELLVHALGIDAAGRTDTKTVCRRIPEENLADANSLSPGTQPTCPVCIERLAKRGAKVS